MKKITLQKGASLTAKLLRLFGMNRGFEEPPSSQGEIVHVGIPRAQPKAFNLQSYTAARQRAKEVEAQKAMLLLASRHDKWKYGGPV